MLVDGRSLRDGSVVETDICIIGAGPAGLTLASQLANRTLDVVLLDSGAEQFDAAVQELNDGDVVGDAYAGLRTTRHRQLGGTSRIWNTPVRGDVGAKYTPLEPVDLLPRAPYAESGWPLTYDELRAWYERAQLLCGLGPFAYDACEWSNIGISPLAANRGALVHRVYQMGTRAALVEPKVRVVREAGNVRLFHSTTAVHLIASRSAERIDHVEAASSFGGQSVVRWSVRPRVVVLAGGAIENARLMLAARDDESLGNESGWLGRGFMEHPRDHSLHLVPSSSRFYRDASFYDTNVAADGTLVLGRLALADDLLRSAELPNLSVTLLPRVRSGVHRIRRALGSASRGATLSKMLPAGGHGWSRHPAPARVYEGFTALLNLEQRPHPDNRVVLGTRRDTFGVRVPELHWRWRAEEQQALERARAMVTGELEAAGFGRVHVDSAACIDPNAHHHAGTTRMHDDPSLGVVNRDGRVHSLENLYVAGASVFPTAGFANPTLTIAALAARMADLLSGGA